jgi:hypothetical protein
MFFKFKLVCVAVLTSCFLGGWWVMSGQSAEKRGRLLSEREMAALYGDLGANNQCWKKQNCACSRKGADCVKCDDAKKQGAANTWYICCGSTGDTCWEDGQATCTNLFFYTADAWDTAVNCCTPCRPAAWVTANVKCDTRQDVGNNYDPCD